MAELDASVFQHYAEYLWRRAGGIVLRSTFGCALVGSVLGSVMLTSWAHWPVPHREAYLLIALGAVSGAFLGRSIGASRALGLRLQAQLAQHQLEFERSTLARTAAGTQVEAARPAVVPSPYLPTDLPPVSAVEPLPTAAPAAAPASSALAEGYGWAALDPSTS